MKLDRRERLTLMGLLSHDVPEMSNLAVCTASSLGPTVLLVTFSKTDMLALSGIAG